MFSRSRCFTRPLSLAALAALTIACAAPLHAAPYFSNLAQATTGPTSENDGEYLAVPLTTDNSASSFTSLSVTLNFIAAFDTSGGFFVTLNAHDVGNFPGAVLATATGTDNPATAGNFTYAFGATTLSANTTYWIVAGVSSSTGDYSWNYTDSTSHAGTWTTSDTQYSLDDGESWTSAPGLYMQFSASASPIPEPSTCALLLGLPVLGYALNRRRKGI